MVYQSQFISQFGTLPADNRLSDVTQIYDGVHQTPHYTNTGIRFISVEDISDIYGSNKYISEEDYNKFKHVPEQGDLIMTRIGTIGQCAVVSGTEPLAYYVSVSLIKPDKTKIDSTYLKYYIESGYGQSELRMRSLLEAFPMKINLNEIGKIFLKVPSMEDQKGFVEVVEQADKSKFDGFKSQFIEMFGSSLQNKELSVKLQDLIERNWITYHLDGNHGGDYPRGEEFVETGIPYISANCIEDHLIKWSRAKYLTKERANLLKKGLAQNNDVLFAHNATVGPVAILRTKEDLVVLGTSLTAYRCNTAYILPEYLLAYMDSSVFRVQYEAGMQQSTRNQVPITTQRNYYFFIPPLPAQRKYSEIFQQADKSKYLN